VWTTDLRNDRRIFSKQYRRIFKKDPEFALNVESWSLIADAIENDLGIGILPDFLENTNPKIVPIKTPIEMMAYDLCAFTRPDERISLNAELFLSELTRPG
jgi:DNA-binding transcriptional LysR family regulator